MLPMCHAHDVNCHMSNRPEKLRGFYSPACFLAKCSHECFAFYSPPACLLTKVAAAGCARAAGSSALQFGDVKAAQVVTLAYPMKWPSATIAPKHGQGHKRHAQLNCANHCQLHNQPKQQPAPSTAWQAASRHASSWQQCRSKKHGTIVTS